MTGHSSAIFFVVGVSIVGLNLKEKVFLAIFSGLGENCIFVQKVTATSVGR